jgi:type II secretory pathway component PulF
VVALVLMLTFFYIGGPRLRSGLELAAPGAIDRLLWALPWRRARLRRDFSAMLAVLLDSRVPEPEAIRLASKCTGNAVIERGAARACELLASGVALPEAILAVDASREFQWRLGNALRGGRAFYAALKGWFASLEAQAFRSEQTAAQVATTLIVLWNGLVIGGIVVAMFLCLIALTERALLW